jgi:hypothetical protein
MWLERLFSQPSFRLRTRLDIDRRGCTLQPELKSRPHEREIRMSEPAAERLGPAAERLGPVTVTPVSTYGVPDDLARWKARQPKFEPTARRLWVHSKKAARASP